MPLPIVLVIEDDTTSQYVIRQLLERFGYAAHYVGTGEDALRAFSTTKYACVMLDLTLPDVDGFETACRMREVEERSGKRTAIIAVTARDSDTDIKNAQTAGIDDYLIKPFDSEDLRKILLRHTYDSTHPNLRVLRPLQSDPE